MKGNSINYCCFFKFPKAYEKMDLIQKCLFDLLAVWFTGDFPQKGNKKQDCLF